jgi:ankyrin repeat protein
MLLLRSWWISVSLIFLAGLSACSRGSGGPQPGSLLQAVSRGDHSQVLKLLSQGADVNESAAPEDSSDSSERVTPLIMAVVMGQTQIAQTLLLNGASTHSSVMGYSAQDLALHLENEDMLRVFELVQAGAR